MKMQKFFRRTAALVLSLLLLTALLLPLSASAQGTGKTVRVGWYESPFNTTDAYGRRSGYAYEYQQKIAAYTGWRYEYVEGSWPELYQLLIDGEIDLMSDVSYTPERAELMLFSTLPMGAEEYYIFISPDNEEINKDDLSTLNGKTVGVNKDSVQAGFFRAWAEANNVQAELIEMTEDIDEVLAMLNRGDIDMYVVLDGYLDASVAVPICKVGASDFYFAVSNFRPELLSELNTAMNRIQEEDHYYNQQLYEKYLQATGANYYLSAEEKAWLNAHGTIRVGYQDRYLAFCAKDPDTGKLTGALKDYLDFAANSLKNANLDIEAVAYPTAEAAMEALKNGEVDCMFPANLTDYDGERLGIFMTAPLMRTDISAVIRAAEQKSFASKELVTVAVNQGNPNYDMFLIDHFPDWQIKYYADSQECLKAVAKGEADCLLISNYRFNNIAALCSRYKLIPLSTGVEMDYCFAVRRTDTALYAILTKVTELVHDSSVNAALNYYSTEDIKVGLGDYVRENLTAFVAVIAAVVIAFLLLILRNVRSEQRADAGEKLISAVERDELTGLYNKNFFFEYAGRLQKEAPDTPMDAVVLNIEQFHFLNDLNGWDFGDEVLRVLGAEILAFLNGSRGIGSRFDADRFDFFCVPQQSYAALYSRFQSVLAERFPSAGIRLRMGVMPWKPGMDAMHLIDCARAANNSVRGTEKHLMIYDEAMQEKESLNQRLMHDLDRALHEHELQVYYQPKYDIQCEPPRFTSAEALIRWQHPELGLLPPASFVPLFETTGQIYEVDKYVWRETARQIAAWREKYGVTVPVSVNLSRIDVLDPGLEEAIDALVEEFALERSALKLEVTESAYTEYAEQLSQIIHSLREKGHEIEMDDFGTGYSSLNMLSSMPVDVLKMDRAFVMNIEHSEKDMRLVELILDIARNLQVPVVAEGVENENQMRMLRQAGCRAVQGYYFSRPLPAAEFETAIIRKTGES